MTGRKLRILVLFGGIPLWGQERENIDVIDALVKETGAECLFVTHREWGHLRIQPELDRRGLPWTTAPYAGRFEKGMSVRHWIANLITVVHASLVLARILWRFGPTHIHVCNPAHFINFFPMLLVTRVPMIYRLVDDPSLHHWAYAFLWRRIIPARVATFVCISHFIQDSLHSKVGTSIKTSVIYGRPPSRTQASPSTFPHAPRDVMKFAYVGQLTERKGVHLLVETCVEIANKYDFLCYIAGDYEWKNDYAKNLIALVKKSQLEDKLIFLGEIEDVDRLFEISNIHVCPSIEEALGLVVFEAKRAGRPSIIFPSGGLPELIRHGCDGWVCSSKTKDALVAAMTYYLMNPGLAKVHGEAARASLAGLGVDTFAERWRAVYDSVV